MGSFNFKLNLFYWQNIISNVQIQVYMENVNVWVYAMFCVKQIKIVTIINSIIFM